MAPVGLIPGEFHVGAVFLLLSLVAQNKRQLVVDLDTDI